MYNELLRGKFKTLLKIYNGVCSRKRLTAFTWKLFSQKNTLYMFGRILRTLLPIWIIRSDMKTFSQYIVVGFNLAFRINLIFCLVHFTLIQIDFLPRKSTWNTNYPTSQWKDSSKYCRREWKLLSNSHQRHLTVYLYKVNSQAICES